MTINELIKELEDAKEVCGGDTEVEVMCDYGDFVEYHVEIGHDWSNGGDYPLIVCDEMNEC